MECCKERASLERLLDLPLFRLDLPTPFPVGAVNVYLITEPEPVLVDTGTSTPESRARLELLLGEAAGLAVSDLRNIVITHGHLDHYGLAQELAERSGAEIFAPPAD